MVNEILRVAGKFAVFGFPCGSPAYQSDWNFQEYLKGRGIPRHGWLEEHMRYQYPDLGLFSRLTPEWSVETSGNDNISFHNWVNRCEMSRIMKGIFWLLLTLMPRAVEAILGLAERAPFYRMIVVVTRKSRQEARPLVDFPTQFEHPHLKSKMSLS